MSKAGRLSLAAAVFVGALVAAAPAGAWWAEGTAYSFGTNGAVNVYAEPGETNDMTASESAIPAAVPGGGVTIHDASAPVTAPPAGRGDGCTQVDVHTLRCTALVDGDAIGTDYLQVDLGDGDDRLRIPATSSSMWLWGGMGLGSDTVIKHDAAGSSVYLGDGDDRIVMRGSSSGPLIPDYGVKGGPGNDSIDVFNGFADDEPACGEDNDTLRADEGETSDDCEVRLPVLPQP